MIRRAAALMITASAALLALAVMPSVFRGAAAAATTNSCMDCHRQLDEERLVAPTRNFEKGVHAVRGLGCVACHGGNPKDEDITAMDPDLGFKGKPERNQIAELCAKCHADAAYMKRFEPQPYVFSMAEFRTSVHCKKASEGDTKVATCTNCHGVHGILSHKNPLSPVYKTNVPATCSKCHNPQYMKGRNIRTDQFPLYKESVHGKALLEQGDLSAPACNNCHGNHGAVPPNTRDIALVCGNCHGREGELFTKSPVQASFVHEGQRGCATCHGYHDVQKPTDAMVATGPDGLCDRCHQKGTPGDLAAHQIVPTFHALKTEMAASDSLLSRADRLGMETSQGRELLRKADNELTNVRVVLHTFNTEQITAALDEGMKLAGGAKDRAEASLRDWRIRRIGMGASLVVILILIALLAARIRSLERRS